MFAVLRIKRKFLCGAALLLAAGAALLCFGAGYDPFYAVSGGAPAEGEPKKYIKWVDLTVPLSVMEQALALDIETKKEPPHIGWIETMAYLSARYGGNYKSYQKKHFDAYAEQRKNGAATAELAASYKHYAYYLEAYTAIFAEYAGPYRIRTAEGWQEHYGLKVFFPLARGYSFSHSDDFGNGRSFGYARKHLGHDLMGSTGTPVIAIESGTVEALGWNMYGGWRIGIRSFDKKRYYYYAHLRKDHPFHKELAMGDTVTAGDVIGYLGMTGYSSRENVNNIQTPHLHFGIQLIFDESQKDGVNQIWIDGYQIAKLLLKNRSAVSRAAQSKDFERTVDFHDPSVPD